MSSRSWSAAPRPEIVVLALDSRVHPAARLAELEQNSASRFRMHEGDQAAMRAGLGLLIDHLHAAGFECLDGRKDIVDSQANVVDTGSALGEKAAHRAVGLGWLQ